MTRPLKPIDQLTSSGRTRRAYRDHGLCVWCGGPRDRTDRANCAGCRARAAGHRAARIARAVAARLCLKCGTKDPVSPSEALCMQCHTARYQRQRAYRATMQPGARVRSRGIENARMKAIRDRRKAAGECSRCGKSARPGRTTCQACADIAKRHSRTSYRRNREAGRCTECAGELDHETRLLCAPCHERHRRNSLASYHRRRAARAGQATMYGRITDAPRPPAES